MNKKDTSWGGVASWYEEYLSDPDSYHNKVVAPNLLRIMDVKKGECVLDLACGSGFFSKIFADAGAIVTGVDISKELIGIAKEHVSHGTFYVSSADDLLVVATGSIDKIVCVLAIQNIEGVKKMLLECARVLVSTGKMVIVMNHPVFRIPKRSEWGFDDKTGIQYRRVDGYLSESKETIAMHPGKKGSADTVSFHRPLQYYFKLFDNTGFAVTRLEEWISHKKSEKGPRQKAEDVARKEIPLFLALEVKKV